MLKELQEALKGREEAVEIGGHKLVVRELPSAADVISGDGEDVGFQMIVRCTFDEEGKQVFTDADIPALRLASKWKFAPLMTAVNRVNGFDQEQNAKNSAAGPG